MEQLGTTLTGTQENQMMPGVMKTVLASLRMIILANGMIKSAAIRELLFARKVKPPKIKIGNESFKCFRSAFKPYLIENIS